MNVSCLFAGDAEFHEPTHTCDIQAQFGEEKFGIDDAKYDQMLQEVDTIIHNAWKVVEMDEIK
jgi:hypothetical protein